MCSVCRKRFACFIRFRRIASWQLCGNVTKLGYSLWWRQASKMKRGDLQLVAAARLIWNFTYIQKKRRVAPRSLTSRKGYSWCTLVVVNQLVLAWSAIYLISNDRSRVFSYSSSYRPVSLIMKGCLDSTNSGITCLRLPSCMLIFPEELLLCLSWTGLKLVVLGLLYCSVASDALRSVN